MLLVSRFGFISKRRCDGIWMGDSKFRRMPSARPSASTTTASPRFISTKTWMPPAPEWNVLWSCTNRCPLRPQPDGNASPPSPPHPDNLPQPPNPSALPRVRHDLNCHACAQDLKKFFSILRSSWGLNFRRGNSAGEGMKHDGERVFDVSLGLIR